MKQIFNSRISSASGSGTRYLSAFIYNDQIITIAGAFHPATTAGILRNFRVISTDGVFVGGSYTPSVYVNGAISALTGVLNTTTASFTDTSEVAIAEGDLIDVRIAVTSGAGAHVLQISLEFEATAANTTMYGYGGVGDSFNTGTDETGIFYHGGPSAYLVPGSFLASDRAATAGTITKHRVYQSLANGASITRTWTIYKNGVAQDGTGGTPNTTITLVGSGSGAGITTGSAAFALSVAANDLLSVRQALVGASSPSMRACGSIEFVSTASNKAHYGGHVGANPSTTVTGYFEPLGNLATTAFSTIEADISSWNGPTSLTFESLRFDLGIAPGVGKSWTFTLRKNGAATLLVVVISGTNTTGSTTALVTINDGDTFALEIVPSGTPTLPGGINWAFLGAIPATTVNVPDVVGETEGDAITAIVAAGLTVGTITYVPSTTVAPGLVSSQSPVAGTVVSLLSVVDLVIAVAAGLVVLIDGIPQRILHDSLSIQATINGRDRFTATLPYPTVAPEVRQELVVTFDGVRIFGGVLDSVREHAATSRTDEPTPLYDITGVDFNALADQRFISGTSGTDETLKYALEAILLGNYLPGITLHPDQVDGPVLPQRSYGLVSIAAILDEFSIITGFVYNIAYDGVLRFWEPDSIPAPFDILDSNEYAIGDIVVEPIATEYANAIIVRAGDAAQRDLVDIMIGNGVAVDFPLNFRLVSHYNTLTYWSPDYGPSGGAENVGPGEPWEIISPAPVTTGSLLRRMVGVSTPVGPATVPPVGAIVNFPYLAQYPILLRADKLAAQAIDGRIIERTVDAPEVLGTAQAQQLADGYVNQASVPRRIVQYKTLQSNLEPGMVQTIAIANRNLSGLWFVTDVSIRMQDPLLIREVTAQQGLMPPQESWRDVYKLWALGTGGGGSNVVTPPAFVVRGEPIPPTGLHGVSATMPAPKGGER